MLSLRASKLFIVLNRILKSLTAFAFLWGVLAFSSEASTLLAPNGEIASITSPYGEIITLSRTAGYANPIEFALSRRDRKALELLVAKGHTLNPSDYQPNSPLMLAVADYARGNEVDRPEIWSLIQALLQLGAQPTHHNCDAIKNAIRDGEIELAILLLNHSRGSLENVDVWEQTIHETLESHPSLALAFLQANRAIPEAVIDLALDKQSPALWKLAADSMFPISGERHYWINGEPSLLPPDAVARLEIPDNIEVKNHLQAVGKFAPVHGAPVDLEAYIQSDELTLLLKTQGKYSTAMEELFLNYVTAICMHRVGKHCGTQNTTQAAERWLENINLPCTGEMREYFDGPLCKLSSLYAQESLLSISIFTREKASDDEFYLGLEAFCLLGQQSLKNGAAPLNRLQKACKPIMTSNR